MRNDGTEAVPGPQSILVGGFVPAAVRPLNALCPGDDPQAPPAGCSFDHRGTYGEDGILSPGETSQPVEWILLDPGGEAFSFRAQIGPREAGPGSIAGIVFHDLDRDGRRDPGEPGLDGITVRLRGSAGEQTVSTNPRGRYLFEVGEAGIYMLDVLPAPGFVPTSPLPLAVTLVRRPDGSLTSFSLGDIGLAPAGNPGRVRVQGRVFEDSNRNGVYDAGELGLAGVKIEGRVDDGDDKDDDDEFVARAVSDSAGLYTMLLPGGRGPWEVSSESIDHFDRTSPKKLVFPLPPPAGESLHADFGYAREEAWPHYEVRGTVYLDANRNGRREASEAGVAGVVVSADGTACDGISHASEATNSHGRYSLDGEDVGCGLPWVIRCDVRSGFVATSPDAVRLDLPPGSGGTFTVDFGVAPAESVPR